MNFEISLHIPVLTKEVLEYLDPKQNENFIDATVGEGGHSMLILEKNKPNGRVLGIDWDAGQIENSKLHLADFKERIVLVNDSYFNLQNIIAKENFAPVHGILLDLGMSSWQLEKSLKGFSFTKSEPLDMRYDILNSTTAQKIINEESQFELEKILKEYGEEKFAHNIAKKIVEKRRFKKIESTLELVSIIEEAIPPKFRHGHPHFATRSFQAIRIAVNRELDNLTGFLPQAIETLSSKGRLVIISFHSLEDKIVKNFFKEMEKLGLVKILTKKPVVACASEILANSRSRSAKLRAIIKLENRS